MCNLDDIDEVQAEITYILSYIKLEEYNLKQHKRKLNQLREQEMRLIKQGNLLGDK